MVQTFLHLLRQWFFPIARPLLTPFEQELPRKVGYNISQADYCPLMSECRVSLSAKSPELYEILSFNAKIAAKFISVIYHVAFEVWRLTDQRRCYLLRMLAPHFTTSGDSIIAWNRRTFNKYLQAHHGHCTFSLCGKSLTYVGAISYKIRSCKS